MDHRKTPKYIYVNQRDLRYHPAIFQYKEELATFKYLTNKKESINDPYIEHRLVSLPITLIKKRNNYWILSGLQTYEIIRSRPGYEKVLCVLIDEQDPERIYDKICSEIICDKLLNYIRKIMQIGVLYQKILDYEELSKAVERCIRISGRTHLTKFIGANYRTLFPLPKRKIKK